ncbi:hypothetical protein [Enterobacter cloacae]|uniref:hypothetical protein n=2 Tax=Enterobacter cloacae TaxID=550 RepID=UPI00050166BB|nr:hypothetical protein [Enterobacter cloacae]KGB10907.1 hypothetical protein DR74_2205 [Enterobacter cloacae]MBW4205151.1 hypothetical protein [Enterobacter cloacae subsp. cloacae]MBW4228225.1 hypothetical protein [Enterobacter cloacae subsp. cloacae]MCK6880255.1 hypothetical protein [Enterobacter cloacae]MCK6971436.1 hypothetical protein [Enterobacter cloacae]
MENEILEALKKIHDNHEKTAGSRLPYFDISLDKLLFQLGLDESAYHENLYAALESLEEQGLIYDQSTSNGGFGRMIGTDDEISHSIATKIRLAH